MKVGDIIRMRDAWERTEDGGHQPRTDDEGWEGPMLVLEQYPHPDEALFNALWKGEIFVVGYADGLREIEVISESD